MRDCDSTACIELKISTEFDIGDGANLMTATPPPPSRAQTSTEIGYDTTLLPGEYSDLKTEILVYLGDEWLHAKNVWLGGRSPAELIGTPDEFQVRLVIRSIKATDLS
jgi:hypothetical protein